VVCGDCDRRARAIDDRRLIFDFDPIPIQSAHLCVARRRQRTPYSHRPRPSRAASSGKFGLGPESQMRLILQEVIFCIWVPTFTQALPLGDPEKARPCVFRVRPLGEVVARGRTHQRVS
jgi:hypothetical protein